MFHLRVTSPSMRTSEVVDLLDGSAGVANVAVIREASVRPVGDLVLGDVTREAAEDVIDGLRRLGIDTSGTIAMEVVDTVVSVAAERAQGAASGEGADAVIWEEVVERVESDATLSKTFVWFFAIATTLAAIAIVLDSAILVVGAMVVGPEFGTLAGISVGLVFGRFGLIRKSVSTLAVGLATAVVVTTLAGLLAYAAGWIDTSVVDKPRPLTGFIWTPDRWSFVVAFIAGIAGILSLTSAKSGALVGVFISVTTVPATGNFALALAFGDWTEMAGSATQLGINVSAIVLAGSCTLLVQRHGGTMARQWLAARRPSG